MYKLVPLLLFLIHSYFAFSNGEQADSLEDSQNPLFLKNRLNQIGLGKNSTYNDFLSPNIHRGPDFRLKNSAFKNPGNLHLQSEWNGGVALGNNDVNESDMLSFSLNYRYTFAWMITEKGGILPRSFFLGPSAQAIAVVNTKNAIQNTPFAYRYSNTIGLAFIGDIRFHWNWIYLGLNNQFFLPLLGVITANDYASSLPIQYYTEHPNLLPAMQVRHLPAQYGFTNVISLDVAFGRTGSFFSTSRWRISYYFTGTSEKLNNIRYGSTVHSLMIGRIIQLHQYKE